MSDDKHVPRFIISIFAPASIALALAYFFGDVIFFTFSFVLGFFCSLFYDIDEENYLRKIFKAVMLAAVFFAAATILLVYFGVFSFPNFIVFVFYMWIMFAAFTWLWLLTIALFGAGLSFACKAVYKFFQYEIRNFVFVGAKKESKNV